jgi:hypothetical protein
VQKIIKDRIRVEDKWLLQVVAKKIALMRNMLREMDR